MSYRFGSFELDAQRFELLHGGMPVAAEPQVVALLLFLIENRDRLVTRDEIVDAVWSGRIVSDAAISSRIKSARQAVGDDGNEQRIIRTIHGRGFRFIAEVEDNIRTPASTMEPRQDSEETAQSRPSIAVLPLAIIGDAGRHAIIAEALPHEVIAELCRLRWLFVIARNSSFRFAGGGTDARQIKALLGVRYLLSGTLEVTHGGIVVCVELADTNTDGVIWAERYVVGADAVHQVRTEIVSSVAAAMEIHIPLHEASRARLSSPDCLDAWSAYHLGLQRMFRFTAANNAAAAELFTLAVAKEPGFARAHAGLSFTHFQNAFLDYTDPVEATARARTAAERALELDPLDPFVNCAMGRSHWLSGELHTGLAWLDRSTSLSPNYAQGTYARAWTETLLGHGDEGQRHADRAMALSPIDPLRYAMLATRALSHLIRGEYADAVSWADRAAREPGAHALIAVIAAACSAAASDQARGEAWISVARAQNPGLSRERFFRSFPFGDPVARQHIFDALGNVGLD